MYRVYCSSEAHSSIDKAVRIAGIGHDNLVKIPVDDAFKMDVQALKKCIDSDLQKGFALFVWWQHWALPEALPWIRFMKLHNICQGI